MKAQLGVDVFDMARMERAIEGRNPAYFDAIFAPGEQAEAAQHINPTIYYATRFALKEAAFKALQTHWTEEMDWKQISTRGSESEAPKVKYEGALGKVAKDIGVSHVSASISYDKGIAFAAVVLTVHEKSASETED